jgi:hypothetical protein
MKKVKRQVSDLDPELEALLKPCRIRRQVPPELRARVLSRARSVVEGAALPPAPLPEPQPIKGTRGRRMLVIALVASAAVAGAAVGAAAALRGRGARVAKVASADVAPPAAPLPVTSAGVPSSEPPATAREQVAAPPHPARAGAKVNPFDPFTAELELLQRAHGAYTRRDFSLALTLVAEHARRFANGHLAEQREALRVRSLLGAGRADEAHRAAAAFAVRFPRSVLLPRAAGGTESSPSPP